MYSAVIKFSEQFKGVERIAALEKLFPHIRFYLISPKFLLEKVENDRSLDSVKCLQPMLFDAYKYKVHPDKFKFKRRKYSSKNWLFATHETLGVGPGLVIEEEGTKLKKAGAANHSMALGNFEFVDGVNYWEIHIIQFTSGINIGVVCAQFLSQFNLSNFVGSLANTYDYCMYKIIMFLNSNVVKGNTATKICAGQSVAYGSQYTQGDKIGILLDLNNFKLSYFHNGRFLGVAYDLPKGNIFLFDFLIKLIYLNR